MSKATKTTEDTTPAGEPYLFPHGLDGESQPVTVVATSLEEAREKLANPEKHPVETKADDDAADKDEQ